MTVACLPWSCRDAVAPPKSPASEARRCTYKAAPAPKRQSRTGRTRMPQPGPAATARPRDRSPSSSRTIGSGGSPPGSSAEKRKAEDQCAQHLPGHRPGVVGAATASHRRLHICSTSDRPSTPTHAAARTSRTANQPRPTAQRGRARNSRSPGGSSPPTRRAADASHDACFCLTLRFGQRAFPARGPDWRSPNGGQLVGRAAVCVSAGSKPMPSMTVCTCESKSWSVSRTRWRRLPKFSATR